MEELPPRGGMSVETVGMMVNLATIEPDPRQPRTIMGNLEELAQSILEKGVLEPILVRPNPEESQAEFRIISGERRFRAAMEAGLEKIPVIEMVVGEEEALEIALIENLQRKDLTPFEEAEGYRALSDRYGYTHEKISSAVGKSRTVITESLALLKMSVRVREAAQALGIQTKSLLLEVLKCEDENEMIQLLEEVSRQGLNRDQLRVQKRSTVTKNGSARRKPFVFNFRPPDKSFSLALKFKKNEVSKGDLIKTLEQILLELRADVS
jgi:ParB family chromosome partitioning protein